MQNVASPELSEYIRSMPETACFLFVESEVDKRGKLYKAVKEKGRIVEMTRQDGATLQKWVLSMIQKEGKQITQSAVRFFLTKVGDDMENIHGELEKLFFATRWEGQRLLFTIWRRSVRHTLIIRFLR